MRKKIGVLANVALREAWAHEAYDFTTWMQQNIDVLGNAIGISFDPDTVGIEQPAGTFSADIVAETSDGRTVIVENQYGKSNHDHLGKLITYLVAFEADYAVWVVEEARPEHIAAVTWLNEQGSIGAFLVKVQALRIDDSLPAPLFTQIVGPDEATLIRGEHKQQLRERHLLRQAFWKQLIPVAAARQTLPASTPPGFRTWLGRGSGAKGLTYNYGLTRQGTKAELYIDRGDQDLNERIFHHFRTHQEAIEDAVGTRLSWQPLEDKQACRIAILHEDGGYASPRGRWPDLIDTMVDSMAKLQEALKPYLATAPTR